MWLYESYHIMQGKLDRHGELSISQELSLTVKPPSPCEGRDVDCVKIYQDAAWISYPG